jgi:hypothetical protein
MGKRNRETDKKRERKGGRRKRKGRRCPCFSHFVGSFWRRKKS